MENCAGNSGNATAGPAGSDAKQQPTFIDLFSGIGGIRLGLEQAGLRCVFSSEIDAAARRTHAANFSEEPAGDVRLVDAAAVPDHALLAAGFPCQSFSISGRQGGFADARGTLFFEILRIAAAKGTPVLLLENVKHLVHHNGGRTLATILGGLAECGYAASWKILNAKDFGVAQNRERIVIVADRGGRSFDFSALRTSPPVILRDTLDAEGDFQWLRPEEYTLLEKPTAAKSGLVFAGYRNKRIRVAGVRPGTERLSRVHKQPNRIYCSSGLHPTLSAGESSGRYFILHEGRVRRLTLAECYELMGFPKGFVRPGPPSAQYRQVGNSVCVKMFAELGREVTRQLLGRGAP